MADDPIDAFDKIADDIQRRQDELDAADQLRSAKEADKRKRKADEAADPPAGSTPPPKID